VREVLNAQNLDAIRELGEKLAGVQVTVKQEQYTSPMLKKYAAVELANLAPAYVEDPGVLVVSDVFEPQHVRENPPPVEVTKDELEQLAKKSKGKPVLNAERSARDAAHGLRSRSRRSVSDARSVVVISRSLQTKWRHTPPVATFAVFGCGLTIALPIT
jgi:hypothetical protein